MLTLVASREQQDRNIGATDQQKRSHRAQQEIKRSSERPGIYVDNAGHFHLEAVRIFCWRLLSKLLQNGLQLGACLRRLHPRAEFERSGKMDVWVLCNLQRNINVRGAPLKTRRHHANDLVGLVHQLHGAADDVVDSAGHSIARGAYSPRSQIVARLWSFGGRAPDLDLFRERFAAARRLRRDVLPADTTGYRAVNSEGDRCPGVLVDVFGEVAVRGGQVPPIHGGDVFEGLGLAELIDLRAGEAYVVAIAATLVHKPNLHNAV